MEAIRYYVKGAFVGIPETGAVLEQQEELIADLSAKVDDLVAQGKTEDEALGVAIASVGDLSALVREFAAEEAATVPEPVEQVPTYEVHAGRLRLHSVTISVVAVLAVLFVLSVMAAWRAQYYGSDGLVVLAMLDVMLGLAGLTWIGYVLVRLHIAPDATGTIQLRREPLKVALIQWAVVCAGALLVNGAFGSYEFWAWAIWIAAFAWPASVYVEQRFVRAGKFVVARAPEAGCEAVAAAAASGDSCAPSCG